MNNFQIQKHDAELEKMKAETFVCNKIPGNGWMLCFVFDDGEIYTPEVLYFAIEGSVGDNWLSRICYFDKFEKAFEYLFIDGGGRTNDLDFIGMLSPGQRIPKEWKQIAKQKAKSSKR